jgi:hypothetical protein
MAKTLDELKEDLYSNFNGVQKIASSCLAQLTTGRGSSDTEKLALSAVQANAETARAIIAVETELEARKPPPKPLRDPELL